MCGSTGDGALRCDVVANWDCAGDDCNDKANTQNPGKPEIAGTAIDEDCDGLVDHDPDPDGDGVCPQSSCAVQQVDSCPGVWNPTNDPGRCAEVEAADGPHVWPLGLRDPAQDSGQLSHRERAQEPVEVALANGYVNADILGHWWTTSGQTVTGSGPEMTPNSAKTTDALLAGDLGALSLGVAAAAPFVSDDEELLDPPGRALTIGGWFNFTQNTSSAVVLSFRYDLKLTLGLTGGGSNAGAPSAGSPSAASTATATTSRTASCSRGRCTSSWWRSGP